MTAKPYGSWPSLIDAAATVAGGVRLGGPSVRGSEIFWSESRPEEGGRTVVVRSSSGETTDLLDDPYSARSQVHEYGGGAWWLGESDLFFVNWDDQRIYRVDTSGAGKSKPKALTPEPPSPKAWRFADGCVTPDGQMIICVLEDHTVEGEPSNSLVAVPLKGKPRFDPVTVNNQIEENPPDFVSTPRVSPDGRWLSWIRWNHPNMPWDSTELCVAPLWEGGRLGQITVIAGSTVPEAVHGSNWLANGSLVYSSDVNGWWNLYKWAPQTSVPTALTNLDSAEIGAPSWGFGTQRWVEIGDSGRLAAALTHKAADRLVVVEVDGSVGVVPTEFTAISGLAATETDAVMVAAGSKALPAVVGVTADLDAGHTFYREAPDSGLTPDAVSQPESMHFLINNRRSQMFFYPPVNPEALGPDEELPPLIVIGHGGPTAHSEPVLNLRTQFWTSRGFAVADVNYGGSTGFGKAYRRLLNDAWGIVDVQDCIAAAEHLAKEGLVDANRMAIRGSSAGGLTVLRALQTSSVFSAGVSLYGVADLTALVADTHKFESRYCDGLIGTYPDEAEIYTHRSPIHYAGDIEAPLLVMQGDEDKVVPPSQSEAIVAAVAANGLPHAYLVFEGEQHGFRKTESLIRAQESELSFYAQVFGFEPDDKIPKVELANSAVENLAVENLAVENLADESPASESAD